MPTNTANRRRASISPTAFDPTDVFGRPKPRDPSSPPPPVELAFETPVLQKTSAVQVRPEDKQVFDALQAWWHFRHGKKLTQWEMFTIVLTTAVANRDGALHPALDVLP